MIVQQENIMSQAEDYGDEILIDIERMDTDPTYFDLPKKSATLIGMPALHVVPEDERATPRPSKPPPPPPRRRRSSITMPSVRFDDQPENAYMEVENEPLSRQRGRKITAPTMAAVTGVPSDHEFIAASHAMEQAREFDRMRDTLLAFPDWVPVSQPMMAVMQEAKRFRQIAAQLLHVDPIELED